MKLTRLFSKRIVESMLDFQKWIQPWYSSGKLIHFPQLNYFTDYSRFSFLGLAVILSLNLYSCKKDKVDSGCHSPSLISQIKLGDNFINDVTYNENCQIAESVEPTVYQKFIYSSDNRLLKVERAISFDLSFSCVAQPELTTGGTDPRQAKTTDYSEFEYSTEGKLNKKYNYFLTSGNPVLSAYQTYEYVNDRISKISMYNPDHKLIQYTGFTYDDVGNVATADHFLVDYQGEVKHSYLEVFEYDTNTNPFMVYKDLGEPGKYTNANNILLTTSYFYTGTSSQKYETPTVYEYNTLGLPIKSNGLTYVYTE